jgi:hypothetical protein
MALTVSSPDSMAAGSVAVPDAAGLSAELIIRKAFVAGAGGAPDDVVTHTAGA